MFARIYAPHEYTQAYINAQMHTHTQHMDAELVFLVFREQVLHTHTQHMDAEFFL